MAGGLAVLTSPPPAAAAEGYPGRPVNAVVGGSPGQSSDLLMRLIAQSLGAALAQPVVVDNRPGAGASLGPAFVARAPADGYTILMGTSGPLTIRPNIFGTAAYDPVQSFAPVAALASAPLVLAVAAHSDMKSLAELVSFARKKDEAAFYGSPGVGSINHLTSEMFATAAGVKLRHVPYKGTPQVFTDVLGGQIHFVIDPLPSLMPHIRGGRMRALAVADDKRSPLLPDVPTFSEAGMKNVQSLIWFGILAPARTPTLVLDRLEQELDRIRSSTVVQAQLGDMGLKPMAGNRAAFSKLIQTDTQKWKAVIQQIGGIRPEE
jgi:tripartite-type tricarboxylate transporter receptor subunit TctC